MPSLPSSHFPGGDQPDRRFSTSICARDLFAFLSFDAHPIAVAFIGRYEHTEPALHYVGKQTGLGFVACPRRGCPLCQLGLPAIKRMFVPVVRCLTATPAVIVCSVGSNCPGNLGNQIRKRLNGPCSSMVRAVWVVRQNSKFTLLDQKPVPQTAIDVTLELRKQLAAGEIDFSTWLPRPTAEELRSADPISVWLKEKALFEKQRIDHSKRRTSARPVIAGRRKRAKG